MASYHFKIKTNIKPDGTRISATDHSDYVNREGKYKDYDEKQALEIQKNVTSTSAESHAEYINREAAFAAKGGCVYQDCHLPSWANRSSKKFWSAAEKYEATSTTYREIEFALPNELNLEQQLEVVNQFVQKHLGNDFYWSLAIHEKEAALGNGERNPHVHIMFSERKLDDIEKKKEREPKVFFSKANRSCREKGGPNKDPKWNSNSRFKYLVDMRKDCAMLQNLVLGKYGYDVRVDHRTLEAQRQSALECGDIVLAKILDRRPETNVGPKHVYQENDAKVLDIKKYREIKFNLQKFIVIEDVLEKLIAQEEEKQSASTSMEQAEFVMSEIKKQNQTFTEATKNLTATIIEVSKEFASIRGKIIWEEQARIQARRNLMSSEEQLIEKRTKVIYEEKITLRRREKDLYLPKLWTDEAIKEYTEQKKAITKRLNELDQEIKANVEQLQIINAKFFTVDYKIKVKKELEKILTENKAVKEHAAALQNKLDYHVAELKDILSNHLNTQEKLIEDHINHLLAAPLAERNALQLEKDAFQKEKAIFATKPIPKFYHKERPDWEREQIELKEKEEILHSKEQAIESKIQAIKTAIYDPKKISASLAPDVAPAEVVKTQFTAQEVQEIIHLQLENLRLDLKKIEAKIKDIESQVISLPRAESMAKAIFLADEFKKLQEDKIEYNKESKRITVAIEEYNRKISEFKNKKEPAYSALEEFKNAYSKENSYLKLLYNDINTRKAAQTLRKNLLDKKELDLDAKCTTPAAKISIEKTAQGILVKNQPIAKQQATLIQKRDTITKEIAVLTKTKQAVDKQVKNDYDTSKRTNKPPIQYKVHSSANGGGSVASNSSKGSNNFLNPVNLIATALSGDSNAVPLVMRIDDSEEYDCEMMTEEQKETALAKIKIEQGM